MTAMRTSYLFDAETGGVVVSRLSRETTVARMMDVVPRAPHLADLVAGVAEGLNWAIIPAGMPFPFIRADESRANLFIVGDDFTLATGPEAFHRKTLRRILGRACFVGIVPGAPVRAFYGRAISAALASRGWSVLIETQPQERDAWLRFAARHARAAVELPEPE